MNNWFLGESDAFLVKAFFFNKTFYNHKNKQTNKPQPTTETIPKTIMIDMFWVLFILFNRRSYLSL